MPWWAWTLIGVAAWLWMTRLTLRWSIELDDWSPTVSGILVHLAMWWVGFCVMLPARLEKVSMPRMSDRAVRLALGESGWYRRKRVQREIAAREAAIRQAERELGIGGDE